MGDELVGLAILAVYLLFQFLGRKRKATPQARRPSPHQVPEATSPTATGPAPSSDLEEALREISDLLGGRQPARPKAPTPPTDVRPTVVKKTARERAPIEARSGTAPPIKSRFDEGKFTDGKFTDGKFTGGKFDEDAFERRQGGEFHAPLSGLPKPRPATAIVPPVIAKPPTSTDPAAEIPPGIIGRLRGREALRDAVVLAEILGPPRALSPFKPRPS